MTQSRASGAAKEWADIKPKIEYAPKYIESADNQIYDREQVAFIAGVKWTLEEMWKKKKLSEEGTNYFPDWMVRISDIQALLTEEGE